MWIAFITCRFKEEVGTLLFLKIAKADLTDAARTVKMM
jgi:hypothetical protein